MAKKAKARKTGRVDIEGVNADDVFTPLGKDSWRTLVDFKGEMADEIKALGDRLGINWQATIKLLIDEALTARKERDARIRGAG